MPPSDEAGFFDAMREAPDDDVARLVYADWLDEHGDDTDRTLAELIRVACRLEHLPAAERPALQLRERELLAALADWLQPLQAMAQHVELRRGLVEEVTVTASQLRDHGEAITRLVPLAELSLRVHHDEWRRVMDCPQLRKVTRLEQRGGGPGDDGLCRLADSPHVGRLRSLVLHHCGITGIGLAALLRLDLTRLRVLNLGANNLRDDGMALLCQAPALAGLELLSLGANELYLPSVAALAAAAQLCRLRDLNLGANYFGDDAVARLAAAAHLASLHRLDLRSNEFGEAGALALARSPYLTGLEFLDVSGNRLGGRAGAMLRQRFGEHVQL